MESMVIVCSAQSVVQWVVHDFMFNILVSKTGMCQLKFAMLPYKLNVNTALPSLKQISMIIVKTRSSWTQEDQ